MSAAPSSLASQIDQARQSGYTDDEILSHLSQTRSDLAQKIQEAQGHGYSSPDVVSYLKDYAPTPAPSPDTTPQKSNLQKFGEGVWDTTVGGLWNTAKGLATHPVDTLSGMAKGSYDRLARPVQDVKGAVKKAGQGDWQGAASTAASGLTHAVSSYLMPPFGTVQDIADVATGNITPGEPPTPSKADPARAAGMATGTAAMTAPMALGAGTEGAPVFRNLNNPVEEAALSAQEPSVPMTAGQRLGNRPLQRVEQGLQNLPGSTGRAADFYAGQRQALGDRFSDIATSASPQGNVGAYGAGDALTQGVQRYVSRLKSQADQLYSDARTGAQQNQQTLVVGQKTSPVLGPSGQPITTPVTQTFDSPVDLSPIRQQLTPIYTDLSRSLPIARQQASPAFAVLKDIMTRDMSGPDRYMNAMDFDKSLGAIKSLTRDGDNPFLTTQSQGIAKQVISQGEKQLQQSLDSQSLAELQQGRKLVRQYHDAADLIGDYSTGEPAVLYQRLVTGGDRVADTLAELKKIVPNEVQLMGRTFLDSLVEKATNEGGYGRASGVAADWNRIGPRTKSVLFGSDVTKDIDNFTLAAKRLTSDANPSGSAHQWAAMGALGAIVGGAVHLLGGDPLTAMSAVGTTLVAPNVAARVLFSPGGARALANLTTAIPGSRAFVTSAAAVQALAYPKLNLDQPPNAPTGTPPQSPQVANQSQPPGRIGQ